MTTLLVAAAAFTLCMCAAWTARGLRALARRRRDRNLDELIRQLRRIEFAQRAAQHRRGQP